MKRKLLAFCLSLLALVVSCQLSVASVFAAPAAPSPKPCEDALLTDKVTKSVTTPIERTITKVGKTGTTVAIDEDFQIPIDFSALQAIFAGTNANYLDTEQNSINRDTDLMSASMQNVNEFHGPAQKMAPLVMTDQLRQKYVGYVYEKPGLPEASNKYSDVNGKNPKTIYELVTDFGLPEPPSWDGDQDKWDKTWASYWDKMPTAVSEFFYGKLAFAFAYPVQPCPKRFGRLIYFVMPEFYRTTSLTNQLNQLMVPSAAQSTIEKNDKVNFFDSTIGSAAEKTRNLAADIISACLKPFIDSPLSKALQKAIKISLNFLNPVKNAYAAAISGNPGLPPGKCPTTIIPIQPNGKKGNAPFCSLPENAPLVANDNDANGGPQLDRAKGENCSDNSDPNKLDGGHNVVCTFVRHFHDAFMFGKTGSGVDGAFDSCTPPDKDGNQSCTVTVKLYPMFYIPWLGQVWNNTIYSDKGDFETAVFGTEQETGRGGIYSFFKPNALDAVVFDKGKNLAAQKDDSTQIKERYSGVFECARGYTNVALSSKFLQEKKGISLGCTLAAANPPPGGPPPVETANCSDPAVQNPSDGNPANGIETSQGQLECYIVQIASGKREKLSGDSLPDVMIRVMRAESNASQCAISTAAAIGVFQFIAGTWNSQSESSKPADSGNSLNKNIGSANAGQTCWGLPGPEPIATQSNLPGGAGLYNWVQQSGGPNQDSDAWNPFAQIRAAARIMENTGGCIWNPYQDLYPQNCHGFDPAL